MNRAYQISFALAVLATGFLLLILCGVAQGQELTEQQRQERCQNNTNRIAELRKQSKQLDEEILNFWSDEKIARARSAQVAIRRVRANPPQKGESVPEAIYGVLHAFPELNVEWDAFDSINDRLEGMDRRLSEEIALAKSQLPRRVELEKQKVELERQIQEHRVNLSALRCDELKAGEPKINPNEPVRIDDKTPEELQKILEEGAKTQGGQPQTKTQPPPAEQQEQSADCQNTKNHIAELEKELLQVEKALASDLNSVLRERNLEQSWKNCVFFAESMEPKPPSVEDFCLKEMEKQTGEKISVPMSAERTKLQQRKIAIEQELRTLRSKLAKLPCSTRQ